MKRCKPFSRPRSNGCSRYLPYLTVAAAIARSASAQNELPPEVTSLPAALATDDEFYRPGARSVDGAMLLAVQNAYGGPGRGGAAPHRPFAVAVADGQADIMALPAILQPHDAEAFSAWALVEAADELEVEDELGDLLNLAIRGATGRIRERRRCREVQQQRPAGSDSDGEGSYANEGLDGNVSVEAEEKAAATAAAKHQQQRTELEAASVYLDTGGPSADDSLSAAEDASDQLVTGSSSAETSEYSALPQAAALEAAHGEAAAAERAEAPEGTMPVLGETEESSESAEPVMERDDAAAVTSPLGAAALEVFVPGGLSNESVRDLQPGLAHQEQSEASSVAAEAFAQPEKETVGNAGSEEVGSASGEAKRKAFVPPLARGFKLERQRTKEAPNGGAAAAGGQELGVAEDSDGVFGAAGKNEVNELESDDLAPMASSQSAFTAADASDASSGDHTRAPAASTDAALLADAARLQAEAKETASAREQEVAADLADETTLASAEADAVETAFEFDVSDIEAQLSAHEEAAALIPHHRNSEADLNDDFGSSVNDGVSSSSSSGAAESASSTGAESAAVNGPKANGTNISGAPLPEKTSLKPQPPPVPPGITTQLLCGKFRAGTRSYLASGERLEVGEYLANCCRGKQCDGGSEGTRCRCHMLKLQPDGGLVLYRGTRLSLMRQIWRIGPELVSSPGVVAALRPDGNLVVSYRGLQDGVALWEAGAAGSDAWGYYLVLQGDTGELQVMSASGQVIWTRESSTALRRFWNGGLRHARRFVSHLLRLGQQADLADSNVE